MKCRGIVLTLCVVVSVFGAAPVFAEQGVSGENTVSRPQGPTPRVEIPATPNAAIGIPPNLVDVRYRKCPIRGRKVSVRNAAIFEGKVYHFCCDNCVRKFWENPPAVIQKLKNPEEVPLTITNENEMCPVDGKPASREFFQVYRDTVSFFCCSDCRKKGREKKYRTPVSRQKLPETTGN